MNFDTNGTPKLLLLFCLLCYKQPVKCEEIKPSRISDDLEVFVPQRTKFQASTQTFEVDESESDSISKLPYQRLRIYNNVTVHINVLTVQSY